MYIVYKDATQSPKYFTVYNGLVEVSKDQVEMEFKDFRSKEEGIVQTTIAIGAMEGDRKLKTDQVSVFDKKNGSYIPLSNKVREEKNFFNSSITIGNEVFNDRNPNSINTLGFDLLKMEIPNENNELFDYTTTQANLIFQGKADRVYLFFVAFETEINNKFLEEKSKPGKKAISLSNVKTQDPLASKAIDTEVPPIEISSKSVGKINDKKSLPKQGANLSDEAKMEKEVRVQPMSIPGLDSGYYLVTNVFSSPSNAKKWSQILKEHSYVPGTFISPKNKWNYVYIATDEALKPVYEKWKANKNVTLFKEMWIIKINL